MQKNVAGQKVRVFAFNRSTAAPVLGDAANITCKVSKDNLAATALADTNPTETEDGYYLFDLTQSETNADTLDFYPESSTASVQVVTVSHDRQTIAARGATAGPITVVSQEVLVTKAVLTTYETGQTLYWFPLSRSLADWATYRVIATEASAPNIGKYSATLASANVDLASDPDATFVLFVGAAQPSSFTEGVQTTALITPSSSGGTRTILATGPESSTLYWYPISRSLNDWETYRTLATESGAPNPGRYTATLSAINADLTVDPYATFMLFVGAAQPSSFNDSIKVVVLGAASTAGSSSTTTETNYAYLQHRVGKYLFGIRSGFSGEQQNEINDCVHDGLNRVYAAHAWSFLRPVADVSTTAPYTTGTITIASGVVTLTGGTFPSWAAAGVLQVNNQYYSVASRDIDTQITLDATSVTVAAASSYQLARPEIPLGAAFEAVANDSDLMYYPSPDYWYPPVRWRHDSTIRQLEGNDPKFDRPVFYSVRAVTFDPTVGSRKVLVLYPTPDQVYTLRVPMVLRPLLVDEVNLYAIGGEMLSQLILEACLAAAEHNFEEREHVHENRYRELIGLAIRDDQDRSSPTSLGPDAPRGESSRYSVVDYAYRLREQRIGQLTLGGDNL